MERNYHEETLYKEAKKRVKDIKGFYIHGLVYICINLFIVSRKVDFFEFEFEKMDIGDFALPFFWGIGLLAHCLSLFGPELLLGKKWEEKKINELMNKEKTKRDQWE